jgi:hypothetical protein
VKQLVALLAPWCLLAGGWHLPHDPFTARDGYRTTKEAALEKPAAAPGIRPLGVIHGKGGKEVLLEIEPEGVCLIREEASKTVNLLDGPARIRIEMIEEESVVISVNGGEGVRYALQ